MSIAPIRARAQSSVTSLTWSMSLEADVGDVRLAAGDPVEPADASRRVADAAVPSTGARSPPAGAAAAASSTASKICSYPAQRQRLPASPSSISARVGCGVCGEQRRRRRPAAPGCRTRTARRRSSRNAAWSGCSSAARREPLDRRHAPSRPPRRRARGRRRRSGRRRGPCTRRTPRRGSTPSCRSGRHRRAGPRAACGAAATSSATRAPVDDQLHAPTSVTTAAPGAPASRSIAVADRPEPEDVEHREPVLGTRPHRPRRRAGLDEHGLEALHLGAVRRGRVGQDPGLVDDEQRPRAEAAVARSGSRRRRRPRRPASPRRGRGRAAASGGRGPRPPGRSGAAARSR